MKTFLTSLIVLASVCMAYADEGDNLILWWVDEPMITETDGTEVHVSDLVGRGDASGKQVNAVRIKATDGSGTGEYLNLKLADENSGWLDYITMPAFDSVSGATWSAGPAFADISGYAFNGNDASISFMIELGNYTPGADGGVWLVMATSEVATRGELRDEGYILAAPLDMHGRIEWQPSFNVPEPCSGVLILIGGGLLALRRRRRA